MRKFLRFIGILFVFAVTLAIFLFVWGFVFKNNIQIIQDHLYRFGFEFFVVPLIFLTFIIPLIYSIFPPILFIPIVFLIFLIVTKPLFRGNFQKKYKKSQLSRAAEAQSHHLFGASEENAIFPIKFSDNHEGHVIFFKDQNNKYTAVARYWDEARGYLYEFTVSSLSNLQYSGISRSNRENFSIAGLMSGLVFDGVADFEVGAVGGDMVAGAVAETAADASSEAAVKTVPKLRHHSLIVTLGFDTRLGRRCIIHVRDIDVLTDTQDEFKTKFRELIGEENYSVHMRVNTLCANMGAKRVMLDPRYGDSKRREDFSEIELLRPSYIDDYEIGAQPVYIDRKNHVVPSNKRGFRASFSRFLFTNVLPLGSALIITFCAHVFLFKGGNTIASAIYPDAGNVSVATETFALKTTALLQLKHGFLNTAGIRYVRSDEAVPIQIGNVVAGYVEPGEMVYATRQQNIWMYVVSRGASGWIEARHLGQ